MAEDQRIILNDKLLVKTKTNKNIFSFSLARHQVRGEEWEYRWVRWILPEAIPQSFTGREGQATRNRGNLLGILPHSQGHSGAVNWTILKRPNTGLEDCGVASAKPLKRKGKHRGKEKKWKGKKIFNIQNWTNQTSNNWRDWMWGKQPIKSKSVSLLQILNFWNRWL